MPSPSPISKRPRLEREAVVSALVEDRADVLSQSVALLRRRGFRCASVTLGKTDRDHIARLTVTLEDGDEAPRLARELRRLLYVLSVDNLTDEPSVLRELLLVKVGAGVDERAQVAQLCEVFRGRIVDVGPETVIVETTGDAEKIAGFLEVLRPFGILEMNRTGPVVLARADRVLATGPDDESTWLRRRRRTSARRAS
ncbi:MAG: acetolactate synthase small subunit [Acidobacteriota bacterium]